MAETILHNKEEGFNCDVLYRGKECRYRVINAIPFQDQRLSYKAKGILAYLLTKPKNWKGQIYNIRFNSDKDGITAIKSGMKELVDLGYAELKLYPRKEGKFQGKYYEIYSTPKKQKELYLPPTVKKKSDNYTMSKTYLEPWMDGVNKEALADQLII